jgi:hypothetical protein
LKHFPVPVVQYSTPVAKDYLYGVDGLPNSERAQSYTQQCVLLVHPIAALAPRLSSSKFSAEQNRFLKSIYLIVSRKTPVVPMQIRSAIILLYIYISNLKGQCHEIF